MPGNRGISTLYLPGGLMQARQSGEIRRRPLGNNSRRSGGMRLLFRCFSFTLRLVRQTVSLLEPAIQINPFAAMATERHGRALLGIEHLFADRTLEHHRNTMIDA